MYLLDTNVVSEIRKARSGKANPNVIAWTSTVKLSDLYLSVLTIQELETGILQTERRDPRTGQIYRTWLTEAVLPNFMTRILDVDLAVAQLSARLNVPDPKPFRDVFIAATALAHNMIMVTRNVADFVATGVTILNPWLPRVGP